MDLGISDNKALLHSHFAFSPVPARLCMSMSCVTGLGATVCLASPCQGAPTADRCLSFLSLWHSPSCGRSSPGQATWNRLLGILGLTTVPGMLVLPPQRSGRQVPKGLHSRDPRWAMGPRASPCRAGARSESPRGPKRGALLHPCCSPPTTF